MDGGLAALRHRADVIDEHPQRRRHLALARIGQEETRKRGRPVLQQRNQPTGRDVVLQPAIDKYFRERPPLAETTPPPAR